MGNIISFKPRPPAPATAGTDSLATPLSNEFSELIRFELEDEKDSFSLHWRVWVLVLILAILLHLIFLAIHVGWLSPAAPAPVEVQQIDPRKLDAIRRQWKNQEKNILLDKNKNAASEKEAPPNARYMSDRNIRVEKEQRAKETNVIPKAGHPDGNDAASNQPKTAPPPEAQKSENFPNLGNLGIPFNLKQAPKPPEDMNTPTDPREMSQNNPLGGDQAVDEKNLPVGSENMLNAEESVYYSFYSRLYEAIGPLWQSLVRDIPRHQKILPGDYTTVVDVVFDKEGNLIAVHRMQTSGVEAFDAAVDASWHKLDKFPNPPKGLLNKDDQVHTGWTFRVEMGEGVGLQYAPPERNY